MNVMPNISILVLNILHMIGIMQYFRKRNFHKETFINDPNLHMINLRWIGYSIMHNLSEWHLR